MEDIYWIWLSRIKEIGVLRAIGVKKKDIFKMFIGEIISITTVASMPGIILMTYILSQVSKISYVSRMFIVNSTTVGISIAIVYLFNIIVGLLPLYKVLICCLYNVTTTELTVNPILRD